MLIQNCHLLWNGEKQTAESEQGIQNLEEVEVKTSASASWMEGQRLEMMSKDLMRLPF